MAVENGDGPSALDKKIIRQVEYYFGDMNLPRDRFLQEKIKEDDGWVTMDTMLNFNRLKNISDDKEVICKALKKSTSGLVEVHEDLTKIRRSPGKMLPDNTKERKEDINARSVYVKGFPIDSSLDTLMEFFEKFGKIDAILMRRNKPDKAFKGSIFVTFSDDKEETSFLELESVKYQETELIKMKKDDYFKMKSEAEKEKRKGLTTAEEKEKAEKRREETEKKLDDQMTTGAVLFMKGLNKDTTLEGLKTFFGKYGTVAWVEFASGDEKALVRFDKEAQVALDKAKEAGEGKVVMNGAELETRIIEGEEEKDYWRKMFRDVADRNQRNKTKHFQNRKRKFGGGRPSNRNFGKKRDAGGEDGGDGGAGGEECSPQKKARKTDDAE